VDSLEKIPKIQKFRAEWKVCDADWRRSLERFSSGCHETAPAKSQLGQLRKIFSSKLARKATFWDKGGQISTSKSHLLDKEIANFRSGKATFSDHPLHELPGA
jgi:hypothetical protein